MLFAKECLARLLSDLQERSTVAFRELRNAFDSRRRRREAIDSGMGKAYQYDC